MYSVSLQVQVIRSYTTIVQAYLGYFTEVLLDGEAIISKTISLGGLSQVRGSR